MIYITLVGLMCVFQRSMIYFPPVPMSDEKIRASIPSAQIIHVESADNISLRAILIPPKDEKTPLLLVFHGNGAQAAWLEPQFRNVIKEQGVGVLLAEYRGYGGNDGDANEQGLYADGDAYLAYVRAQHPHNPVILYGQSLGSGVAVDVASRHVGEYDALILEVPFDTLVNVVGKVYPFVPFPSVLVKDKFLSIDKISKITAPKLFLLAGQDEIVGHASGLALYNAADDNKVLADFPVATHMGVYQAGAGDAVTHFIQKLL